MKARVFIQTTSAGDATQYTARMEYDDENGENSHGIILGIAYDLDEAKALCGKFIATVFSWPITVEDVLGSVEAVVRIETLELGQYEEESRAALDAWLDKKERYGQLGNVPRLT